VRRRKKTRNRRVAKACFILEIFATDFVSDLLDLSILPTHPIFPIFPIFPIAA
jgi:hypothetical protein